MACLGPQPNGETSKGGVVGRGGPGGGAGGVARLRRSEVEAGTHRPWQKAKATATAPRCPN